MECISEIIRRNTFLIENGSHWRDAVIIILEGKFWCEMAGREMTLVPGDICVFPKNVTFRRKVTEPLKCIYLQYDSFPVEIPQGVLKTLDPERTKNTVVHLTQAVLQGNQPLIDHFVRDLFILHHYPEKEPMLPDATVLACVNFFNEHYREHISLDMLTEMFGISKQGLNKKFKRYTYRSTMEYLASVRLAKSKIMLRDTALSVTEIADRCGFENVYYFSNFFKRATAMTPTAYRLDTSL